MSVDRKPKQSPRKTSINTSARQDYKGLSTHDLTMMSMKQEDNYTPLIENNNQSA